MKTKLTAIALFGLTAAAVALVAHQRTSVAVPLLPPVDRPPGQVTQTGQPRIDVVFVLDTTGSMAGLIEAAKEKIWSIATTMAQAQQAPHIRMGLVAYRDRGDAYVTRSVPLSDDLDSVYAALMEFRAGGGGDTPEAVNEALHQAVNGFAWRPGAQTYRAVFLVGDAPPHTDYADDVPYARTLQVAARNGIVVNAIQSGDMPTTVQPWREIAALGQGAYFKVGTDGSAIAIATPFDKQLANLSAELDDTRLSYGSADAKRRHAAKRAATEKLHAGSSDASRARRATFNVSESGKRNAVGESDLVADVAEGRVSLDAVSEAELPSELQGLSAPAQAKVVERTAQRREALRQAVKDLAAKRSEYLKERVAASPAASTSLDAKLFGAIREQAAGSGLRYDGDSASY